MDLYIVGKLTKGSWEFQGIFDDPKKAADACPDGRYFVGPAQLNKSLPEKRETWKGAYFPFITRAPNPIKENNIIRIGRAAYLVLRKR